MNYSVFFEHISHLAEEKHICIKDAAAFVARMGYTSADISLTETDAPSVLKACGISVNSIYGFFDLGRTDGMSKAMRMIDMAAALNSAALIVPGFLSDSDALALKALADSAAIYKFLDTHPETVRMRNALARLSEYGAKVHVSVMIENFDSHASPIERADEIAWLLEGCPKLDYNLDTGNFAFADENVLSAAERFLPRIRAVHLKDRKPDSQCWDRVFNRGMEACAVGSGYIPIKPILDLVLPAHPECPLSAEHFNADNWGRTLMDSITFMKSVT